MTTEEKLTDEQAEAMLKQLSRHYNMPVLPLRRYCEKLETWATCMQERASDLRKTLFPNLYEVVKDVDPTSTSYENTPRAKEQRAAYEAAQKARIDYSRPPTELDYQYQNLRDFESAAGSVEYVFRSIHKSNLLARILYEGEKLRTQKCPEHKGKWSGCESGENICPHKCQLTGWIQEPEDMGRPLPGVMAVQMVPTGEAPGEVTVIRSVDGKVLGKAVIKGLSGDWPGAPEGND
jgi:hypothetical protein